VDQGDWPVKNGFAVQEVIDMIKTHNAAVGGHQTTEAAKAARIARNTQHAAAAAAAKSQ
jgi:hypothetical protein